MTPGAPDPEDRIAALHGHLSGLRRDIGHGAALLMADWRPALRTGDFLPSADNLAHYLAFRRFDLSTLQPDLRRLGLSTLGRCEPHVLASLDAVLAALVGLRGGGEAAFPQPSVFTAGSDVLRDRQSRIFGRDPGGPRTRIMVTLPSDAAVDGGLIPALIANGADCVRINCAHDNERAWAAMIAITRRAAAEQGRDVRVAMDLAGPKIRIREVMAEQGTRLFPGDRFVIAPSPGPGARLPRITLSHSELLAHLTVGAVLAVDDGKLLAKVVAREGGIVTAEVTHARARGLKLKPEKGVNLPGAELAIPALTADDLSHLDFVAANADIVGYSFVQTPEDVRRLAAELETRMKARPLPALMLKIETPLAVRNLPRLLVQAGASMPVAVMIARGDLAVEIGFERLSEVQEEILWLCEAAHVPVVWATQVLETLVKEGAATRAETTDAAMGQRAECVMLNKGPHLAEAVAFLDGVLRRMDRHQMKKSARLAALGSWDGPQHLRDGQASPADGTAG
ncbi:pyruvate kinase [Aestuariivirga sp.]|uniref:pyruvate kinase n=1 Tax=Aestuariivirga sp. TaxID=2650926 RepID=UPI0025C062A4|nr:pyruvate kinase [Aestuariivirga sp.]